MTNHLMAPENAREIQFYTGKALKEVSRAIADPAKSVLDSTVATVWLLSNYEVIKGGS